jgi:catechol 2,3-dioxygenase-like lactoylglutathione lyase family enzyme
VAVHGINHIAFRTPDPAHLRAFYLDLLDAEPLSGSHDPIRAGAVVLAFFESSGRPAEDPDEIAFDVDAAGFDAALGRARRLDAVQRDPVAPNPWQRFVVLRDPDGRRIELTHDDRGVYWQED